MYVIQVVLRHLKLSYLPIGKYRYIPYLHRQYTEVLYVIPIQ